MYIIWVGIYIALCQNVPINKKASVWQALSEHFSGFFGADRAFQWEKWSIKVEYFSGETKA